MARRLFFAPLFLSIALIGAGCSRPDAASSPPVPAPTPAAAAEHGHKPGQHGGGLIELGRDNYHAEPVFEKGGVVKVYLLGKDEVRVQEVERQTAKAYVKADGQAEPTEVEFRPAPQPGDAEGMTSCLVAQLPSDLVGKAVEVTILNVRFPDGRYRIPFRSPTATPHEESEMPTKVSGGEEERLYLTPGGLYTEADIAANGRTTASAKFKGVLSSHTAKTKPGDRICPISETKANPKFSWVIGGKSYEFCCPPCVDEFLKEAKENPPTIKPPEEYVRK